jgi:hypothetical protein
MANVVWHPVPAGYYTATGFAFRPASGVVLHDTETEVLAAPHAGGSWHYEVARDGVVHGYVPEADVAHHVARCDRWWPSWLPHASPWAVSPANAHTIGIELVSSQKWRNQGLPYTRAQYRALQALLLDLRSRYGGLPVVGHGHVQADRSDPVWLDWQAVLEVTPEVALPLQDARRSDPLLGGYGFAQWTGSVFHCAVDLNAGLGGDADLGKPVRTPVAAVVAAVLPWDGYTTGEGNHVWLKADDGHWLHLDHLQEIRCREGDVLARGAEVGACGKTGNWPWAHCHWEVLYDKPAAGWWQWPVGWSKARVLEAYMDPFAYLTATWPTTTGGGGGTVDEPVLSDAELEHEYRPLVWGALYDGAASDFAVPQRWKAEVRLGNDLGKPLGPEADLRSGGKVQFFERGPIFYKGGKTSLVG